MTTANVNDTSPFTNESLIALYNVYQTAISSYTNVIWIYPGAFLALNITAWIYLGKADDRWLRLSIALADILFTQAFLKLVANERAIITAIRVVEDTLRVRVNVIPKLIPNFKSEYNRITRAESGKWFSRGIGTITVIAIWNSILEIVRHLMKVAEVHFQITL
jgi:hypothetical protein